MVLLFSLILVNDFMRKQLYFRNILYWLHYITVCSHTEPRTWPAGFDLVAIWAVGRNLT